MIEDALPWCYVGLSLALLFAIVRLVVGPTNLDRILAFDAIAVCAAGMITLYSIQISSAYYVEVLMLYSLLGFTTVLGCMDYLSRRRKMRGEHHD